MAEVPQWNGGEFGGKASFPLDKRKSNKIKRNYIEIRLHCLHTTRLSMPGGM
jgi:hypothetical protein